MQEANVRSSEDPSTRKSEAPASASAKTADIHSKRGAAKAHLERLDTVILAVAAFIVLATTILLFLVLFSQMRTYDRAIAVQLEAEGQIDHSAVLAYARATDFAAAKLSALFLGFLLIFLGAMFVLRVAQTNFALSVASSEERQLAFSTSSPGLAMVTLGVLLIVVVLFSKSTIDYKPAETPSRIYFSEDEAD